MSSGPKANILQKVKSLLEEGNYYDAHQLYRTACNRYVKANNHEKAIKLLKSGAHTLADHQQYNSTIDLMNYMLELYVKNKTSLTKESLKIPHTVHARKQFVTNIIHWTIKVGYGPTGYPELHDYIGFRYWKEGNVSDAERHFFLGTEEGATAWGEMLYDLSKTSSDTTRGTLITRAVLQYLSGRQINSAQVVLNTFKRLLKEESADFVVDTIPFGQAETQQIQIEIYRIPLVNYCTMVILAVEHDAHEQFMQLKNHYKYELDDSLNELVKKVAEHCFDVPNNNPSVGLIRMMLSGLAAGQNST
jgi:hypothetical protein